MQFFKKNTNHGTAVALVVTVLLFLSASCSRKNEDSEKSIIDRGAVPGMYTDSITTLISDSGIIRYRIFTKKWIVFDKAKEPYWFFPNKLHFERFDDSMRIESVFDCDTARYFSRQRMWELKNNVRITNMQGEVFETQLLYWNQRDQRVYSDSFIRIEQKKAIISGYGFESDQTFTKYRIFRTSGPISVDSEEPDSLKMDPNNQTPPAVPDGKKPLVVF